MKEHTRVEFIQHDRELDDACRSLQSAAWLGVDTEFVRERTYHPVFCLLQIATEDRIYCIDPQTLTSIDPLSQIFQCPRTLKIFHSARQDIEVLLSALGHLPVYLHDTQIAAGLAGYPDQIGYGNLVEELFTIRLDKSHTRTDWTRRPLSSEQLRYAGEDVAYLIATYQTLVESLNSLGRLEWLKEDCAALLNPSLYSNSIEDAWKRVKGAAELTPKQLNRVHAMAAWREETARAINLPRNWVLRDEYLCEIARLTSRLNPGILPRIKGVESAQQRQWGVELMDRIEQADRQESLLIDPTYWTPRVSPETRSVLKDMSALVQQKAAELNIVPSLLASRRDLDDLMFRPDTSRINKGWRYPIIGQPLSALRESKQGKRIDDPH